MNWQKIETAPKDEAILLLASGDTFTNCVVVGKFDLFLEEFVDFYGYFVQPTHWMKLPDPPKD